MVLIINQWTGRLTNNILQIIRAIHYAKIENHSVIIFKNNNYFKSNQITLNKSKNNTNIFNTFFNIKTMGCEDPSPLLMKEYFNTYIFNIMNFKFERNIESNDNILHIHIRAGDVFQGNGAHSAYVQPPLKYYKDIIDSKDWKKIIVVYQDLGNPCVQALKNLKYKNIIFDSNSLEKDLNILLKANHLVLGFGTFGLLLYFLNNNLKDIYIPKYVIEELPNGSWGDVTLNIKYLPNYIKCGEWKNEESQKRMMLTYK
tara:strand:- start:726 stop:1496 length:771 start_codon:yes stop_codon:yes gene_type:complete